MVYTMVILKAIMDTALECGGVVRPKQIEDLISNDENLSRLKISRYKIRQFFKELKEDGLLAFDGHKYIYRETHWLNGAGNDIINNMNLRK